MKREAMNAEMVSRGDAEKVGGGGGSVRDPSHNSASRFTSNAPWPKVKLGAIGKVVTGMTPPTKRSEYYTGSYLFVTPSDLFYDSYFINATERTISEIGHSKFATRFVPKDSVMYTCIASIGKIGIAQSDVLTNQQINSIIPSKGTCGRFIYYLLRYATPYIQQQNAGCAVPIINKGDFENIEIPLPPLPIQRRIADVLSAYDDLIENNRRRIAILEETARLAYRKWFGEAEQGRTATLGEVAEVLYGKDHKKIPDGTIPIFGSGGVMRYGATAIFDKPSVLIPRKGTIGNVMYVDEPFWTVDTMFYTRFKLPNMEKILYYQLCDYNLASMSTGAAVPSMTTAILNSLKIVVPPDNLRVKFDMAVEPMFLQKCLLKKQNASLAAARNMLLPRLMNNSKKEN